MLARLGFRWRSPKSRTELALNNARTFLIGIGNHAKGFFLRLAKDIMTKQKMKIWFKKSKDSVTSPKIKFIGDEWYFTVQKDVSNTLRITFTAILL
uniref:Uncharacterized protein n=1 Tax=Ditylenchus dipsaci TaxID=166011 RepID=A0A915DR16_9BILA